MSVYLVKEIIASDLQRDVVAEMHGCAISAAKHTQGMIHPHLWQVRDGQVQGFKRAIVEDQTADRYVVADKIIDMVENLLPAPALFHELKSSYDPDIFVFPFTVRGAEEGEATKTTLSLLNLVGVHILHASLTGQHRFVHYAMVGAVADMLRGVDQILGREDNSEQAAFRRHCAEVAVIDSFDWGTRFSWDAIKNGESWKTYYEDLFGDFDDEFDDDFEEDYE